MIEKAVSVNVKSALDSKGEALKSGLEAKPFLIKPNRKELEEICGGRLASVKEISRVAKNFVEGGIETVIVSLGGDGMILVDGKGVWRAVPPEVNVVSSVGSGDALLAGFISSYLNTGDIEHAICLGMACGVANCTTPVTGVFGIEDMKRFQDKIVVEKL